MKNPLIFLVLMFPLLIFADGGSTSSSSEVKHLVCSCTSDGHAFVYFIDGLTGQSYGRGLYPRGHPTQGSKPALPLVHAGLPGPASTLGADQSSSSNSISGSTAGSSSSSATTSSPSSSLGSLYGDLESIYGQGVIADDGITIVGKKCVCYEVTTEEYNGAIDYVNNYLRWYAVLTRNCVYFADSVLGHLGKERPSIYSWYGVPTPWDYWANMNEMKKVWDGENRSDRFIDYGNNTERFKKYKNQTITPPKNNASGNTTCPDANKTNETMRTILPNDNIHGNDTFGNRSEDQDHTYNIINDEMKVNTEDVIKNPDYLYNLILQDGSVPTVQKITIITNPAGLGDCGINCTVVAQNTPVRFSTDFTPRDKSSLTWWDLGDGTRVFGSTPTHIYSAIGIKRIKMRYLDEARVLRFAYHTILVVHSSTTSLSSDNQSSNITPSSSISSNQSTCNQSSTTQPLSCPKTISTPCDNTLLVLMTMVSLTLAIFAIWKLKK